MNRKALIGAVAIIGAAVIGTVAILNESGTSTSSRAVTAPTSTPTTVNCTVDPAIDSEEQAFLVLINNYRAQNGLGPLTISYKLTLASAWKSVDMAVNNYVAHDDLTRTWVQRIRDCGYGYNVYLGENLAAAYPLAQQVFDQWRGSPAHNDNMLGVNYTAIGIGRYFLQGSFWGWYWTTDFGGFSDGWSATSTPTPTPNGSSVGGVAEAIDPETLR